MLFFSKKKQPMPVLSSVNYNNVADWLLFLKKKKKKKAWDVRHPSPLKNELSALSLIEGLHTSWINRLTLEYAVLVCVHDLFIYLFFISHPHGFSNFFVGDQAPGHHND